MKLGALTKGEVGAGSGLGAKEGRVGRGCGGARC